MDDSKLLSEIYPKKTWKKFEKIILSFCKSDIPERPNLPFAIIGSCEARLLEDLTTYELFVLYDALGCSHERDEHLDNLYQLAHLLWRARVHLHKFQAD